MHLPCCIDRNCGLPFDHGVLETRDTKTLRPFWYYYCPKHRVTGKEYTRITGVNYSLKSGMLAYFDSFAGLTPCKVLRIYKENNTVGIDIVLTASRGPYKKGETIEFLRESRVVPRKAVYTSGGKKKIRKYIVEVD